MPHSQNVPMVDTTLRMGLDVGGTKIAMRQNSHEGIVHLETASFPDMYAVLDTCFESIGKRPQRVAMGIAGPRDDVTGSVTMTNAAWPLFDPREAASKYPGTQFATYNDMVVAMAGILPMAAVLHTQLKAGMPLETGTKLAITVSTGVGAAFAVWDNRSERYVIAAGEGGHIGIQPYNPEELGYLEHLHKKYPRASVELGLSGRHGIDNLIDYMASRKPAPKLMQSVNRARAKNLPVGAVLLAYATEGEGQDRLVAQQTLQHLGALLGAAVRDLAVVTKATGGIYLMGSVAVALGMYLADETPFLERFVHAGATHDGMLKQIPIFLVSEQNVGVHGALALAD